MELIVQKFGGATLADLGKIKSVAVRIHELKKSKKNIIVIVSTMGKTTDTLIAQSYNLSEHPNQRELDVLLSTGEVIPASYLAIALNDLGRPAISFTGTHAGFIIRSNSLASPIFRNKKYSFSSASSLGKIRNWY
ncbi:MAG: hypothetical protein PHY93_00015 [Bacteriovorax sp.]|nr:hypothetical protein [Bacteriovorax sp.]